jgi:hypothetical protein
MLTEQNKKDLEEITRLLDEGLKHYLTYESHCKSAEGHVEVSFSFGNSWERFEGPVEPTMMVSVYSYALGPHRNHDFDSLEEALEAVREWHEAEMSFDPEAEGEDGVVMKALANIFEAKPVEKGRVS